MKINESTVKTGPVMILWDGITRPETKEGGGIAHTLRVAMPSTAPEYAELYALANAALAASEWKGVLPPGAAMPFMDADVQKFGPLVTGCVAFTASTYRGAPPVYDVAGNKLDPIQYNPMLYAGAKVALLCHAYPYNNKKKGIALGLNGFQIIDGNAPRLDVGGSSMPEADVSAAFGGRVGNAPSPMIPPQVGATPPPPPGQTMAPPPPPSQALTPKLYNIGGHSYTAEQLKAGGYTDANIAALG